eukprot:1156319-Pelagomonas_calceolata.AAC.10
MHVEGIPNLQQQILEEEKSVWRAAFESVACACLHTVQGRLVFDSTATTWLTSVMTCSLLCVCLLTRACKTTSLAMWTTVNNLRCCTQDVVVPIHDCEPSSIIAHCLASRPYHLLLNAAIKNMLLELRRGGRGGSSQESSHPYPTQSSTQTASGREGASSVSGAGPQIASAQPVQQAVSAPAVAANTTAAASQLQQQQQQQQQGLWPAASQSPAVHQERLPPTQPVPASLSTMSVPSKGQAAISGSSSTSTSSSNGSIPAPPSGPPCVQENNGSNCNKAADLPSSLLLSPSKAATAANGSAPSVPLSSSTTTTTNHTSASAPADDVRAAPANAVRTGAGADASLAEDVGEGGVRAQQQQQQQQQAAVKHAQNGVNKDGFGSGRGGVLGGGGGGLRLNDLDWLSVMLSHEPVHLRHGFEDEGLGMPWTRAKFQVCQLRWKRGCAGGGMGVRGNSDP